MFGRALPSCYSTGVAGAGGATNRDFSQLLVHFGRKEKNDSYDL